MKLTLSWLKDHLETNAPLDKICEKLSAIGLEVEAVEDPAQRLGAFVIARILDAKQHPQADRLRVCQIETAPEAPPVEVVCGAPNARAGLVGVFAPLGTFIPGTGITLDKRPVRGVVSNGMMVSERELELSEDHEGIIELAPELSSRIGERYIDIAGLNDPAIDVSLTPNRPDCTGIRGIARDLAAAGLGVLKAPPALPAVDGTYECPIDIQLEFPPQAANACPIFAGRYVRGVRNGASPEWLQRRLKAVGLRPISALVDITNYISIDRGRPLHVYDADKLVGAVRARLGRDSESFLGLDGREHQVDQTMCVIADESGPLGLGGIIGGEKSSCTTQTTNVLIESAYFDPRRIAATGRHLSILTDARYRFERGVDPAFVEPGLDLATAMVLELCGGSPSRSKVAGKPPIEDRTIDFDTDRIEALAGVKLESKQIKQILLDLGFKITGSGHELKATVPSWRPDIHGPADLVEEVVRIAGLDMIPSTPMPRSYGIAKRVLTEPQRRSRRARRLLAGRGMIEVVTWSFIPTLQAKHFGGGQTALELENPISIEMSSMRPSLLPGLLVSLQRNRNRGFNDVAVFEVGQAYLGIAPDEQLMLASGTRAGTAHLESRGRTWQRKIDPVDVFDAKEDSIALLFALGIDGSKVQITPDGPGWFHPGRCGTVRMGPKTILGHFGEIHPATLKLLDVEGPVVAFEMFLKDVPGSKKKSRAKPPLIASDLLPVRRDLAFLLDESVPASDVVKAATSVDRTMIAKVDVFDAFSGAPLEKGKKSLAIEITLQPQQVVLTQADIDAVIQRIVANVEKVTGGAVRS